MSEPPKLTDADAQLLWAIFELVPRADLTKDIDWDVVGEKLGLSKGAVTKRWSRLNIKMREERVVNNEGKAGGDVKEVSNEDRDRNDDQIVIVKETEAVIRAGNNCGHNALAKQKVTDTVAEDGSEGKASSDDQQDDIKEAKRGKATAKRGSRKAPVKKAAEGKGKGTIKTTWETLRAERASEAKGEDAGDNSDP